MDSGQISVRGVGRTQLGDTATGTATGVGADGGTDGGKGQRGGMSIERMADRGIGVADRGRGSEVVIAGLDRGRQIMRADGGQAQARIAVADRTVRARLVLNGGGDVARARGRGIEQDGCNGDCKCWVETASAFAWGNADMSMSMRIGRFPLYCTRFGV